jgi:predicted secreted protein
MANCVVPLCFTLIALILLAVYAIQFYLSVEHSCSDTLAIFSLLYSGIGVSAVLASALSYGLNRCRQIDEPDFGDDEDEHNRVFCKQIWRVICGLAFIAMAVMTGIGYVVVGTTDTGSAYSNCDRTLFLYTLWNTICHGIFFVVALMVGCFLYYIPSLYARYILGEHIARTGSSV